MSNQAEKESLRARFAQEALGAPPLLEYSGKIAQSIRNLPNYRQVRQIFVGPAPGLLQVRVNALVDGKELIMPGPGLKEGFYLCKPYSIPFPKLGNAVTLLGISQYGRRLNLADLAALSIGLLVTDAVAVDSSGNRLGDGQGFFDLAHAILAETGALHDEKRVYAAVVEHQLSTVPLPVDSWDVSMDGFVTVSGSKDFPHFPQASPSVVWESLVLDRIRKIGPLWKLFGMR